MVYSKAQEIGRINENAFGPIFIRIGAILCGRDWQRALGLLFSASSTVGVDY